MATSRWLIAPTAPAFLAVAIAEQLGITELHHSKNGITKWLSVRLKKEWATAERESLEVGIFLNTMPFLLTPGLRKSVSAGYCSGLAAAQILLLPLFHTNPFPHAMD
jgi:hypothetical protein